MPWSERTRLREVEAHWREFLSGVDVSVKQYNFLSTELLRKAKEYGFSDAQLANLLDTDEISIRKLRKRRKIEPVFKLVDTCAAEFEAYTPYYYSTYETEDESR